MRPVASGTDATSAGTTAASCRLTYGQAIYWIDPLLTMLDKALRQLADIREIESRREQGVVAT